ncbi:MAG: ABC transporter ATP-binding protein [Pseudomonadota bacterium]
MINTPPPAIELRGISKRFGTVQANKNISLSVKPGTIHGIVGENGAGKSTLMNIIFGLHQPDEGQILIDGNQVSIKSSADAISLGIGMVHQHFMLVPKFSVLENVMLGNEGGPLLSQGRDGVLAELKRLADTYGMHVDPNALVENLPVGTRQRVEIIKAMRGGAQILILDEPTGVLTPQETIGLFDILRELRDSGVTIIIITHKLGEIMDVTDAVTIIRNGTCVGERVTNETDTGELAELMVGRKVLLRVDRGEASPGEIRLAVRDLGCFREDGSKVLDAVSFDVQAGEILGVAGVAGNGQSELLEILSGMRRQDEGTIDLMGECLSIDHANSPRTMRETQLGHIPEDRHHHGLVLDFEARENLIFGFHQDARFGEGQFLAPGAIHAHGRSLIEQFDVRPDNPELPASKFSGGNQQKLVIAREMEEEPRILLVGQPTRGVDIGAIEFIHKQLIELRDRGCAILIVSVELEEIMGLSDRIMVMNDGRVVGTIARSEANERKLGLMMAGLSQDEAA